MKKYLNLLIAPLFIIAVVFLVGLLWKLFDLPSEQELIPLIKAYFDKYGVWLVFASAIIESGFVLGVYAPGGIVIFLGVIFSAGDPMRAILVVASVIVGFLIGFTIDFFLGRYGWYKFLLRFGLKQSLEKTKKRIQKYGISIPWVGYHHPDLGSLIATSYGILQYSYRRFFLITILPVIAWCALWGIIAYTLGNEALKIMSYKTLFIILGVWIVARMVEMKLEKKTVKQ